MVEKKASIITKLVKKYNLKRHIEYKADRVVLYNAFSTINNSIFAIIKLIIGVVFLSLWFLIFGGYYLALLSVRIYFLRCYMQVRTSDLDLNQRQKVETHYLYEGGLLFSGLGVILISLSGYMYFYGHNQHYNKVVVLLIALMGFTKIISSIIGWFKAHRFRSPIILFLKAVSIADGLVAIVITQYVLLSYRHASSATSSTGLFGIGIGFVLVIIGILITIRSRHII